MFSTRREEASELAAKAAEAARAAGDAGTEAGALNLLADADRMQGRMDAALARAQEAMDRARLAGDKSEQATALNCLGAVAWHQGRYDDAIGFAEQALALRDEMGDDAGVAAGCSNLSLLYTEKGELEKALDYQEKGLAIRKRMGDETGLSVAHLNLGLIHCDLGDWDQALECYFRALAERERASDKCHVALCYNNIGELYLHRAKLDRARFHLDQALALAEQAGAPWVLVEVLGTLGETAFRAGDMALAETCYGRDLAICRSTQDRDEMAETLRRWAELELARGEVALARAKVEEALTLCMAAGRKREEGNCRRVLGEVLTRQGDAAGAQAELERSIGILRALGRNYELALSLRGLGMLPEGKAAMVEAGAIFENLGVPAQAQAQAQARKHPDIIGADTTLAEVFSTIERVAGTKANVLILGESGTGKELAARALHRLSERASKPFVTVNCAAIPETLLEPELFGIEKGTATGVSGREGKFETADSGTIFLDEIGDMSPGIQAKLLRVLQERQFERVGARQSRKVDVRVVAATNRNLEQAMQAGQFRQDLFYRLNVITVTMPPLRERRADIPALAGHFVRRVAEEYGRQVTGVSDECLVQLVAYSWPGNVRELENVIERGVILCRTGKVQAGDLPATVRQGPAEPQTWQAARKLAEDSAGGTIEKQAVLAALEESGWVMTRAAEKLGMSRRQLYRVLDRHGIQRPTSRTK